MAGSTRRNLSKFGATALAMITVGVVLASCKSPIVQAACDGKIISVVPGALRDPALREVSGLADSALNPGTLWANNDSGDSARLFAITEAGATRAIYNVTGASASDWEDLALGVGPVPGQSYLYAADIGDNSGNRSSVSIYRMVEPVVSGSGTQTLNGAERLNLRYPDGSKDSEAFFVDPLTGELYLVQKAGGGPVGVYRAPANLAANSTTTLTRVGTLNLPGGNSNSVTAADISRDGKSIAIRSYGQVRLWSRDADQSVMAALGTAECRGPIPSENQGESVGFRADGRAYYTVSEGTGSAIRRFDAPAP